MPSALDLVDTSLRCAAGHNFDLAREGYVNLLPVQNKRSLQPGDDRDMLAARRHFLQAGYYDQLVAAISTQLAQLSPSSLLDIGCGEGFYLQNIYPALPAIQLLGLDISKFAIRMSAKRSMSAQLCVASAASLPYFENSVDCALSIFSPISADECRRVLNADGHLLMVGPGKSHLHELKALLYDNPQEHAGNFFDIDRCDAFSLLSEEEILFVRDVPASDLSHLLRMTPYYWQSSLEKKASVCHRDSLRLQFHFVLRRYAGS